MKTAVILIFISLTVYAVKGQPSLGSQRCLCGGAGAKMVRPKLIENVVIHPPSPSCGRLEIIVTLKNGAGQRCLNPESKFAKNIIEKIAKKKRSAEQNI